MQSKIEHTPVLIVGGSLVGLSAAAFLAFRNVPCLLVEKHLGSSPHPRAIGYTPRTLELFAPLGITELLPEIPKNFSLRRAKVESLSGAVLAETEWTPKGRPSVQVEHSPYGGAAIAQDRLEPLLRAKALELGATLRLGTELVHFTQDEAGVTAQVRDVASGELSTIRAQYLVAADGGRSPIRDALGIVRRGRGPIRTVRSVLFRAELDQYLAAGISQFEIEQADFQAFLTTYRDGRWILMMNDDLERDEHSLRACIQRAIGRTDVPFEILTTGRWELSGEVAGTYQQGRVFLAGDAAHTLPPTRGGFGANTGIDDVHNLAWKLEAVLSERAAPSLLDSYSDERQPIGWLRHQQTFARPDYAAVSNGIAAGESILDDAAIELGQLYRSRAVIGAGPELPAAKPPTEWRGQPGTRAVHRWIERDGQRVSTLDLLQRGYVLVTGDETWRTVARELAEQLGLRLDVFVVGVDLHSQDNDDLLQGFGISRSGASLIRPDGYIGWRVEQVGGERRKLLADALAVLGGLEVLHDAAQ